MPDNIIDDVKKLLDAEIGEKRILQQIKRAAENNEVISNYERNYVAKLVEQHLKPPEPEPELERPLEPTQEETSVEKERMEKIEQETTTQTILELKPTGYKNKKLLIGGGVAVLALIIVVAIGASGIIDLGPGISTPTQTITGLTLDTDQSSYDQGDIISILGTSKTTFGNTISLSIENAGGELIWDEDLKIKASGVFSTLLIAGGPGWENSGTYTLKAEHGSEDNTVRFSFKK